MRLRPHPGPTCPRRRSQASSRRGPSTEAAGRVIELRTLRDGGQDPAEIADALISFFGAARSSLHAAIYDIKVSEEIEARGRAELRRVADGGVDVKLVFELDDE